MNQRSTNLRRFFTIASATAVLVLIGPATSASAMQGEPAADAPAANRVPPEVGEAVATLAEGETSLLRAVVMRVTGRSQWRASAEESWNSAKVDDVLQPGAMIRTGRKSSMALRVGHNATIVVQRNTRLILPQIIHEGRTLRTAVQLTRGRADFKVDRVGLTNDFTVVTPSSTLAVRGTGKTVQYGGFRGTEVFAAPTNAMRAIEARYFSSKFAYYLSGGATSDDEHNDPALNELFKTFGPPRGLIAPGEDDLDALAAAFEWNPLLKERRTDIGAQGMSRTRGLSIFDEPEPEPEPEEPPEEPDNGHQDPPER